LNVQGFRRFIAGHRWHFAESYAAFSPHEYTKRAWGDNAEYQAAVEFIHANANRELFFKKPYPCIYVDGFKYWHCCGADLQWPLVESMVLNRSSKAMCVPKGVPWMPPKGEQNFGRPCHGNGPELPEQPAPRSRRLHRAGYKSIKAAEQLELRIP